MHRSETPIPKTRRGGVPLLTSIALLILIARFVSASAYRGAINSLHTPGWGGGDFELYYNAGQRLNHGERLYVVEPYMGYAYTPLLAILVRPLSRLPFEAAFAWWAAFNVACLLALRSLH